MSYAFLPVNIDSEKPGRPLLAVIDNDRFNELSRFRWQASGSGLVYRNAYDRAGSQETGRRVTILLTLAEAVALPEQYHVGGSQHLIWLNGDKLDCRKANIRVALKNDSRPVAAKAGEIVAALPGYDSALANRHNVVAAIRQQLVQGRKPRLSPAQVRKFLEAVRTDDALKNATRATLAEYIAAEFGVTTISQSEASAILRGKMMPVEGYDYSRLADRLPRCGNPEHVAAAAARREKRLAALPAFESSAS